MLICTSKTENPIYVYTVYLVRFKRKIFNLQTFIRHVAMDSLLCQHGLQAVIWNTNDWWGRKIENPIRNKSEKWDLIFFTYINILKTLLGMSFTFTQNNHSKWTLLVSNINQASWDLSSIKSGISRYWSKHFFYLVFGKGRFGTKGVCNENWGKHRMIIQDTFMQDQYRISAKSNLSYLYSYMTWIIRGSSIYSWHHL